MTKTRTIPGMGCFHGPSDLRDFLIEKTSLEWVASYLDQCDWVQSTRTVIPNHSFAYRQMNKRVGGFLRSRDVKLLDPNSRANGPRHSRSGRLAA